MELPHLDSNDSQQTVKNESQLNSTENAHTTAVMEVERGLIGIDSDDCLHSLMAREEPPPVE